MKIDIIAPDPSEFVSGGNIYNAGLAKGLLACGAEVRFKTTPDIASTPGVSIIDTIYFDRLGQKLASQRWIGLIHHLNSLYPMSADAFEAMDRPALDRMDGFIASSAWTAGFLVRKGYDESIIHVAEPVAPPLTQKNYQPVTKVKALMLNNLVERKGVLPFLKDLAAAKVPPDYELRIIGSMTADRDYAQECVDLVRADRNLSKTVKFLGAQDDSTVRALMQKSNLFISASFMETFGMSIQEAAITGLPLLVMEGGNATNHVSADQNGWWAGDMTSLVRLFEQLIDKPDRLDDMLKKTVVTKHTYPTSWMISARSIIEFMKGLN